MKENRKAFGLLLLYFLFWMIFSWLDRMIFIFWASPENVKISFKDFFEIYYHGLRMDLSMAAYLSFFPFIFFILWSAIPRLKISKNWIKIYTLFLLFIVSILSSINVNLYPQWTDKVNRRAFDSFFDAPKEAVGSADSQAYWVAAITFIGFLLLGIYLFHLFFKNGFKKFNGKPLTLLGLLIFGAFVLFSMVRGGYGKSTLNESMAYYSTVSFKNHAAVNTYWSFIGDYANSSGNKNPYIFFENEQEINKVLRPVFLEDKTRNFSILKNNRPNVVLIIMESFVSDLMESVGGEPGITPNLDSLSKEGYLFTNCYAVSERSDKGMVGIFSGFPAQGKESVIKHINKQEQLPAIGQELLTAGYSNSFYYGGQSEFYNFKSYMLSHGIAKVVDQSDFKAKDRASSWGVFDEKVFERMVVDLKQEQTPFFVSVFTITNHEPFDLPGNYKFGKESPEQKFKSTAFYTDSVIGAFIRTVKNSKWYDNTLFIITADHGHYLPAHREITDVKRFHIPLLFFGNALKEIYKGSLDERVVSQADIATSLLGQLNLPTEKYYWSRNIFNTNLPQYAFFNTSNSWGVINDKKVLVTDFNQKRNFPADDSLAQILKAYNQKVYQQFLDY
ncbi:MAG TPA: LTA synthase family protein [Edaphocola sp.]|nr:LTA synthase family protein [Edaphocola sp.]